MTTAVGQEMTPGKAEALIRGTQDPCQDGNSTYRPNLKCKKAHRVFEPGADGLREVLYVTPDDQPMTAYLRGQTVVSVCEGW